MLAIGESTSCRAAKRSITGRPANGGEYLLKISCKDVSADGYRRLGIAFDLRDVSVRHEL
jgi:hypothetical protein